LRHYGQRPLAASQITTKSAIPNRTKKTVPNRTTERGWYGFE
jgi:hypothetical protein